MSEGIKTKVVEQVMFSSFAERKDPPETKLQILTEELDEDSYWEGVEFEEQLQF